MYPISTTGLLWTSLKNQSTIICAIIPPAKCPIQPLFWPTRGACDTWHSTPHSLEVFTSKFTNALNRKRIFRLGETVNQNDESEEWFVTDCKSQVGTSPLSSSSETQEVRRMDGKCSAKTRWEVGSLGLVSAAVMKNGCCSSYFIVMLIQSFAQPFPSG